MTYTIPNWNPKFKTMKKLPHVIAAALIAVSFGFASCESKTAENVETGTENAMDGVENAADEINVDSIDVRDEPVQDGVADKMDSTQQ